VRKGCPQLHEVRKAALPHDRVPMRERRPCVRMLFRELVQPFPCNDMHSLHSLNAAARSRIACSTTLLVGPTIQSEATHATNLFTSPGVTRSGCVLFLPTSATKLKEHRFTSWRTRQWP
jgi:hypothetical protein